MCYYTSQRGEDKMLKEQILVLFHGKIRQDIENSNSDFEKIQEIRVRAGKP